MIDVIVPDWPVPSSVGALTTLRGGGVSKGGFGSFNLAAHVGDDPLAVAENRQRLAGLVPAVPRWLTQVHGIRCVDVAGAADGAEADAALVRGPGLACAVLTADCLPILLCDEAGTVAAAVHAGWRGLAAGIVEATVAAMAPPGAALIAWLGPAIGPRAFEVGDDVYAAFADGDQQATTAFVPHGDGKWLCDLYALARLRLARLGVTRVAGGDRCTFGERESFYSYRRDGSTGRMATLIWLR